MITIDEVKECKKMLEKSLWAAIVAFETATGLKVDSIEVNRFYDPCYENRNDDKILSISASVYL